MEAITIDRLEKNFGNKHAVRGISFNVSQAEIFGFLGPNGAGKTTTIRCLLDFIRPSAGSVKIMGLDSRKDSVAIKRQLGYLSSDNQLYGGWSSHEHIHYVESIRGKSNNARELAAELGLDLKLKYKNLSSGNKQKLAVVLAIMNQPKVLVMDEPTRGLDPLLQNQLYKILRDFRDHGGTVFMSSHNLAEVEQVCDHVGIIRDGKLIKSESMSQIRALRTHIVTAVFAKPIVKSILRLPKVTIVHFSDTAVTLKVKGDINAVLGVLAHHQLKDLEVTHASLEDIFLEYYKK